MKITKLLCALLALVMLCSVVLPACSLDELGDETEPHVYEDSSDGEDDGGDEEVILCSHAQTEIKNVRETSCAREGYTGDTVCSLCGYVVVRGEAIPTLPHTLNEGSITKLATCVDTGIKTFTCTVCLGTVSETIPLSSACQNEYHYESDDNHKVVCAVCHKSGNGSHTQGDLIEEKAATCLEGAYKIYSCLDCHDNYKLYTGEAAGHNWATQKTTVAPTCQADGEEYLPCTREGCDAYKYYAILDRTPDTHNFELKSTDEASCTETGTKYYECSTDGCNATDTKVIPKLPHTYGAEVDGVKTCSCGHKIVSVSEKEKTETNVNTSALDTALKVELKEAAIEFPKDIVSGADNITVSADTVDKSSVNTDGLNEEQKEAFNADNAKVYDFGVSGVDSNFGENNKVTVTVPYTLRSGEEPDGIVIWYISDSGELTAVENVLFIDEDGDGTGEVVFEVEHFSHYAIAYHESPEMRCRKGIHENERVSSFDATCESAGIDIYMCKHCKRTSIAVTEQPLGHKMSGKKQPVIDCVSGGYVYEECENEGCEFVKNYEYVPSKGHTPVGHATCDTSARCSDCNRIVYPAKGHTWSEWQIEIEPGNTTEGLRRRHCPACGAMEDSKVPPKSNVEAWQYDSLSDLIKILVEQVIDIKDGSRISFELSAEEHTITIDMTVTYENGVYLIEADISRDDYAVKVYYRDGVVFVKSEDGYDIADIDKLLPMEVGTWKEYMRLYIAALDEQYADVFKMLDLLAGVVNSTYGKTIDKVLAAAGSKYTAESLVKTADALKILYAYNILKLGLETTVRLPAEPTGDELGEILEAFMTAEKVDGGVKYTYDVYEFIDAVTAVLEWADEKADVLASEILYEMFGDSITAVYPELTDWSKLIAHLRTEFGGNVKVSALIDTVTKAVESTGKYTVDEIYEAIELMLYNRYGESISIKQMLNEYADDTMDTLAREMFGRDYPTAASVWDELDDIMTTTKFADFVCGEFYVRDEIFVNEDDEWTVSELVDYVYMLIDEMKLEGAFSVTLTDEGKISALNIGGSGTFLGVRWNSAEQKYERDDIDAAVDFAMTPDANVSITLPAELDKLKDTNITFVYDAKGNIVISGIPEEAEVEIGVEGHMYAKISDLVTLDRELSAKLGYDVYVLDEAFWNSEESLGTFVQGPDGTLYHAEYMNESYYTRKIIAEASATAVLSNISLYMPDEDAEPIGEYTTYEQSDKGESGTPVYQTAFGRVYKNEQNEWMVIDSDRTQPSTNYTNGKKWYVYRNMYSIAVSNISEEIGEVRNGYDRYTDTNGNVHNALNVTVRTTDSSFNLKLKAIMRDGKIYFVTVEDVYNDTSYYVIGKPVASDFEYDRIYVYEHDEYISTKDGVQEGYREARVYKYVPTYYAEYDGFYFDLTYHSLSLPIGNVPFGNVDVSSLEKHTLPDGRVLHVVYKSGDISQRGEFYGYLNVSGELYVKTYVSYVDGKIESLLYAEEFYSRYGSTAQKYMYVSSRQINEIIGKYVSARQDGTYSVSAAGVKYLKSLCNRENDYVALTVEATVGDNTLYCMIPVKYILPAYFGYRSSSDHYIDWGRFEENGGNSGSDYNSNYSVVKNADGSITITSRDGSVVDLTVSDLRTDNKTIEDMLEYDAEKSQETGVDVYKTTSEQKQTGTYIYYNRKWYNATEKYLVSDFRDYGSVKSLIASNIRIYEMTYKYSHTVDGTPQPIYYTRFSMEGNGYFNFRAYTRFDTDGSILVLTGVSSATDTGIVYEDEMPIDEYINSLVFEIDSYVYESDYMLSDAEKIYRKYVRIYENADKTNSVAYFDVYYRLVGGVARYMLWSGGNRVYVRGDICDAPDSTWTVCTREDESFDGTDYEVVDFFRYYRDVKYYVKVAGTYMSYDSYINNSYSKEEFYERISYGDSLHYVNGKYYYAHSYDSVVDVSGYDFLTEKTDTGFTHNGYTVYELTAYKLYGDVTVKTIDGCTVYYRDSYDAYAKVGDRYIRGSVYGEVFESDYGSYSEVDSGMISYYLGIRDCITLDGDSMTISADILAKLESAGFGNGRGNLNIDCGRYGYWIDYERFKNMFNR